ncbi:MAG: YraN family protein [Acidobacteriota bacterium]|nr:YraN family protein [Acidobacteriota bacterium]
MAPLYRLGDWLRYLRHGNLGRRGEDLAHRYLRKQGFTVVARNWRPPQGGGELDLIAWDKETLVFVEVKSRAEGALSAPERDIDKDKIVALRRAARDYLRRANVDAARSRFDVIAIAGGRIEHLRDAFAPVSG